MQAPQRRYDRAIFLLLDGARADVFESLLRAGELPQVARHIVEPGGFARATTVFPSVTGVAYAPYLTGCFPRRTNLTGVRWLDRRVYARRRMSLMRFRNYVGPGHFMMNRDLSRDVKTLFELLRPSSNIFGTISRGTGVRRNAFLVRRVPWTLHFMLTGDWAPIDERANAMLLRAAQRRRERFTFHTTLQVDEHSHHDGPFSPRAREGYRAFDRAVGALAARLRVRGTLERTLLCVGSDHGHSDVSQHFDLEAFFERRGLRALYYPKQLKSWFDCDVAVMVGGNGMGHVYFRGAGWDAEETGAERLAHVPGAPRVIDDLLAEDAVDLVAYRDEGDWVEVRSRRGAARVRLGDDVEYELARPGADPFGYPPLPPRLSLRAALEVTRDTDYPDGMVQIAQIFGAPRAGDLIVSSTPGWDLRLKEHRLHRSGHGSLHRDHMNVPFALSYPFRGDAVRSVDAFPTILELLGETIPGDVDGQRLV
jgi:type I phosphodiesterase/nucleotide pyrophosphatase